MSKHSYLLRIVPVLAASGLYNLGAQVVTICSSSSGVNVSVSSNGATCPLGVFGGTAGNYTVSVSGMYSSPTMLPNGEVEALYIPVPPAQASATGFCNGIGGQFSPNAGIESCSSDPSEFCNDAFYQDMSYAPWAPLLPWPADHVQFDTWAAWPACMAGPPVGCEDLCGDVCLDAMSCHNQQAIECVGGCEPYCPTTPIIIDTQNQGFHLTSMAEGVKFTFNGFLLQTSWTDPDYSNAWLALDRNGNGTIDNAGELFGELTPQPPSPNPNGYDALAVFDDPRNGGNGNGKIDPGDAVWPHLRLWIDRNHNGISEKTELTSLSEAGIFGIDLNYALLKRTDQHGNIFRYAAGIDDRYGHQDPLCYDVILMTAVPGLPAGNTSPKGK